MKIFNKLIQSIVVFGLISTLIHCGEEKPELQEEPEVRYYRFFQDEKGFCYNWKQDFASSFKDVPAGETMIGISADRTNDFPDRLPTMAVDLGDFFIGQYEVRVADYYQFKELARGYQREEWWSPEGWQWKQDKGITAPLNWEEQLAHPDYPVVGVSYYEAEAFANSLQLRLPTELEWEKAARGNSAELYIFPWGNSYEDIYEKANLSGEISSVGNYAQGQSETGCFDLVGNVHEWTSTIYGEYLTELTGEMVDRARVIKGASFIPVDYTYPLDFRMPLLPENRFETVGFRVCADNRETVESIKILYQQPNFDPDAAISGMPEICNQTVLTMLPPEEHSVSHPVEEEIADIEVESIPADQNVRVREGEIIGELGGSGYIRCRLRWSEDNEADMDLAVIIPGDIKVWFQNQSVESINAFLDVDDRGNMNTRIENGYHIENFYIDNADPPQGVYQVFATCYNLNYEDEVEVELEVQIGSKTIEISRKFTYSGESVEMFSFILE